MKKKTKLLTVILTILFSFAVTPLVWAECTVEISPSAPLVSTSDTLHFIAETEGEGCKEPNYTWEIVASDCTARGLIDQTGLYEAPEACGCVETIRVTDNANDNVIAEAIVTITHCCEPTVAINPAAFNLAPGETQALTATTTCNGHTITGSYTWDIEGGTANTTIGSTIDYTLGDMPGPYTITVTDTANGNITATSTILIGPDCGVDTTQDSYLKSHWVPLPALIRIQAVGFEVSQRTQVTFECASPLSVIKLIKLVNSSFGIINQFAIIMPSFLTGNFQDETEACFVYVEDCTASVGFFELDILDFGFVPLSE